MVFFILPAKIDLAAADIELASYDGKEFILSRQLEKIKDYYDYILIDCPPSNRGPYCKCSCSL